MIGTPSSLPFQNHVIVPVTDGILDVLDSIEYTKAEVDEIVRDYPEIPAENLPVSIEEVNANGNITITLTLIGEEDTLGVVQSPLISQDNTGNGNSSLPVFRMSNSKAETREYLKEHPDVFCSASRNCTKLSMPPYLSQTNS